MKNPKLSSRYAKALYDFSKERGQVQEVYDDLSLFASTLKENRELQVLLRNPVIEPNKKHRIFEKVFNGTLHDTTYKFLKLLLKQKREPSLDTICEEYFKLYNIDKNIRTMKITTASQLSSQLEAKIVDMLSKQVNATINLVNVIDPKIIGGFKIQMGDYYLDSSIITKINRLRQEFSQNNFKVQF